MIHTGGVATMAIRRRRTERPKAPPPDTGTPETAEKLRLVPKPWVDWPRELQQAMELIREIICWHAGGCTAQAQDLLHVRHHAANDEDEGVAAWRANMVRRYHWWRWELIRHHGWTALAITLVFCDGVVVDGERMRKAVELFHGTPRRVWGH